MPEKKSKVQIEVLLAPRRSYGGIRGKNGWAFPPAIRELLKRMCEGKSVLHPFGGLADFGTRLDIDPQTRPDVIGDAWLPPFAKRSFDVVILDPPYVSINAQFKKALLIQSAMMAREMVIWFHTVWLSNAYGLNLERAWLCMCGRESHVRCLQFFRLDGREYRPITMFERGPAIKYNRWLRNPQMLPFGNPVKPHAPAPDTPTVSRSKPDRRGPKARRALKGRAK